MRSATLLLVIALLGPAGPSRAGNGSSSSPAGDKKGKDEPWSLEAELDFISRYVWRGVVLSDGPVLQPSVRGELGGLNLTAWTNLVLAADPHRGHFSQVGAQLGYEWSWRRLTVEPQLVWVHQLSARVDNGVFSSTDVGYQSTAKLGLELSCELGAKVSLLTRHIIDVAAFAGGWLGELGADWAPEIKRWHLELDLEAILGFASAAFNEEFFGVNKAALNVFGLAASVTWSPIGPLFLRAHLELSVLVDGDLRNSASEGASGLCGSSTAAACNSTGGNFNSPTLLTGGGAVGVKF